MCPFVRLVSGVGDHIIGDRPRPDPGWETASFSVTPAPTAVLGAVSCCWRPRGHPRKTLALKPLVPRPLGSLRCPCSPTPSQSATPMPPASTSAKPSTGWPCPRGVTRNPCAVAAPALSSSRPAPPGSSTAASPPWLWHPPGSPGCPDANAWRPAASRASASTLVKPTASPDDHKPLGSTAHGATACTPRAGSPPLAAPPLTSVCGAALDATARCA